MTNRGKKRALALCLSLALLAGLLPTAVLADEGRPCGHTEHTAACRTDELICGFDTEAEPPVSAGGAAPLHEHGPSCYALDCPHERGEHDEACGYAAAVPGVPGGGYGKAPEKNSGAVDGNTPAPAEPGNTGTITVTAFDGLDEAVKHQTIPTGTELESLTLPATLGASGYVASGYVVSDDAEPVPAHIQIEGVTWELTGEKDTPTAYEEGREKPCNYYFQPVVPEGYELAEGAVLPKIEVRYGWVNRAAVPNAQDGVLTVEFNDNSSGGTDIDNNDMKTAIDDALTGNSLQAKDVTKIALTGDVTEITKYNWKYLIDQYNQSSGWDSLTALDLSGMTNLTTVKNDTGRRKSPLTKLQTLTLPNSVTEIGVWAFRDCTGLKLATLPVGLTKIGDNAFSGCTGITLDELPDGVKQIGNSAFFNCTGITLKELPDKLTKIEGSAFYGCTSLKLTDLPEGVEQIGTYAFSGCTGITLNALPVGLKQIGDYAFRGCTGITSLIIPDGVTEIGYRAFGGCTKLKSVTFQGKTPPTFGADIFFGIPPPAHRVCAGGGDGLSRQLETANRHTDRRLFQQR